VRRPRSHPTDARASLRTPPMHVNQDSNQGEFAFFQPICDGSPHTLMVRAQALGFRYHVGQAQVSAYVLLSSGVSTSPGQTVTVHRGPS
jgi:hypothetical protein